MIKKSDKVTIKNNNGTITLGCVKHDGEHKWHYIKKGKHKWVVETSCGEVLTVQEYYQKLEESGWINPNTGRPLREYAPILENKRLAGWEKIPKGTGATEKKSFGIKGIASLIFALLGLFVILPLPMGIIGIFLAWKAIDDGEIVLPLVGGLLSMLDIWYGITTLGLILDFLA